MAIGAVGAWLIGAATSSLGADPVLTIEPDPSGLKISWDATDGRDFVLEGSDDMVAWAQVNLNATQSGGRNQVLVPTGQENKVYRLVDDGAQRQSAYVGAQACAACHGGLISDQYSEWIDGGHPYKLNKVDGAPPTYFSTGVTNVPSVPEGFGITWDDVSYVIGGAIWKARFVDQDGYIITGTNVQWNLETQGWANYHADEALGTKPYNCGSCHTTGWKSLAEGSVHQEGLPGMHGSFAASGVECEACHGPGSRHVDAPFAEKKDEITIDTSAAMCGQCHVRGATNAIPASGGFIRHHEQWNEMLSAKHAFQDCVTCHDPHKSVKVGAKDGITMSCEDCHTEQAYIQNSHDEDATCNDCHMPKASKSAIAVNQYVGDIMTHIFKINPAADGQMFSPDGSTANGSTGVTLGFACYHCHDDPDGIGGGTAPQKTLEQLSAEATNFHGTQ